MNVDEFWSLIDRCAASSNDPEQKLTALRREIEQLEPQDIIDLENHFDDAVERAYRWDVWAAAYVIHGGCGDDSFMDFRASQILRGAAAFERMLSDPDSLADEVPEDPDEEWYFEGFQYIPMEVYKAKTGDEMPRGDRESLSEPVGEPWNEDGDDLHRICPKLCKKFDW